MKLSHLAKEAAPYLLEQRGDCEISSLSQDSRLKTEDGLFFCISGARSDSHDFAKQAVENGAAALVVTRFLEKVDVPQVLVSNDRAAMALISSAFYGHPGKRMKLIGITGTKG